MMVPFKGAELAQNQNEVGISLSAKCLNISVLKVYNALFPVMCFFKFKMLVWC